MLTILDRALLKETFLSYIAVLAVLSLVIVGQLFVRMLSKAAEGKIPEDVILPLLGLGVIESIVQLMPLALMLGLMLTFGRMYRDNEMAAIRGCGIGFVRLYGPLLVLVIPSVALLALLSLYVSPLSIRVADKMAFEAEYRPDISGVFEGRFIDSKQGNWVIFAEQMDRGQGTLANVFVHTRDRGITTIETAAQARQFTDPHTGEEMLELSDGQRYEGIPGSGDYQILTFDTHTLRIPPLAGGHHFSARESVPTSSLWTSTQPADQAELQKRLSIPLAAVLLVLLALPLSYTTPRQGRFAKLALAVIIYIIYMNLAIVAIGLTETGQLSVWLGVWCVHLLMLIFIMGLFVRQYGWRWSLHRLTLRTVGP